MEDTVKDMILDGVGDDLVLSNLITLTLTEVASGRPLFPNPIDEPYFYQKCFRRWVSEGLAELRKAQEIEGKNDRRIRSIQET